MLPPHSLEAEQSLLGSLLIDNQAFDRVADVVGEADLYRDDHRRIWAHISKLIAASQPADVVTVWDSISASEEDRDKTGGAAYLAALAQNTPSALNIRRYAELVREKALRRRLAAVGAEIMEAAVTGEDVGQVIDAAEAKVMQVSDAGARAGDGLVMMGPALAQVFQRIDQLHQGGGGADVTGLATGYLDLDQKTAGLQPGDLIVIAGRPSMGKTALALNIAEHAALKLQVPVAVFSMEMSTTQLATRLLGSVARVDHHKLRTGRLATEDWAALSEAMERLHAAPVLVDEAGSLNAMEIRARARRVKREHPNLGLVVVDYLQLMTAVSKGENRATEISEASRMLKALAKELHVPVIALSQLSRAVDNRPDKRPIMSDLRESGAIEQDADLIVFLYREVVYKPDLESETARGKAEAIIGKQRNGPIGTVYLTFRGQFTRFENYETQGRFS